MDCGGQEVTARGFQAGARRNYLYDKANFGPDCRLQHAGRILAERVRADDADSDEEPDGDEDEDEVEHQASHDIEIVQQEELSEAGF
jgi:hypothetical protein